MGIAASVTATVLVTVASVYGIGMLLYIFANNIGHELRENVAPVYILLSFPVCLWALWAYQYSRSLLVFLSDYQENVLLGTAAFVIGFSERGKVADGAAFSKRIRIVATLIVVATVAAAICNAYFSPANSIGPWKWAWYIAAMLLAATAYGKVIFGKSKGLIALSKRVELHPLQPYHDDPIHRYKVMQLSDLHITTHSDTPLAENAQLRVSDETLDKLAHMIAARPGVPVIISGDTTDTGNPEEWERFKKRFGQFRDRLVLAPGNHDLNIVGYGERGLWNVTDKWYYEGRIARLRAYFDAAIELMPDRVSTLSGDGRAVPRSLVPLKDALARIDTDLGSRQYQKLAALFPLIVEFNAAGTGVLAIVWNSTRPSALPWWNSLGAIDAGQLARFAALCELIPSRLSGQSSIHVVHHKVGMPLDLELHLGNLKEWKHKVQFASMTMQNPWSLVQAASDRGHNTVILHGHHHVKFAASVVDGARPIVDVISAPSSTLHCEGHIKGAGCVQVPGFDVIALGAGHQGTRVIAPPRWHHAA